MLLKQRISIKNKTTDFFLRNLLTNTPFIVISYKNSSSAMNGVKTITKNQICTSLSHFINKKTEKFPLSMNTFNNINKLSAYLYVNTNVIISLIKIKNMFFKGKNMFKKLNILAAKNTTAVHSILTRKYFLFKLITTNLELI